MAQFRTTADIVDLALLNGGEVTNGNSPYESQVLGYLNRVHMAIVAGGTIPIGKDTTVEIDEVWPWARSRLPLILELQPKFDSGTLTLTQGSEAGTFSSAPSVSLAGWYFRVDGSDDWFRIASHTAAASAFELDAAYTDASSSGLSFEAVKLDYDLLPSYIVIDDTNNNIQVQKLAGTTLTGTLTKGSYTPAALATHVAAIMTTAMAGPTVTGSYSATSRLFSFVSDLAGATIFRIVGDGSQSALSVHKVLGFDDETTTSAATQTSVYALGGIARLIEPFKINKDSAGSIFSTDAEKFQRKYPLRAIGEGQPDRFCVVRESSDGVFTVRFNAFPEEKTRVEIDYIPVPRDLKDSSSSVPLLPRKHVDVLEDAATFYLMLCKSDDRMQIYSNLLQGKLKAMISQHRGSLLRAGENFGQLIPRKDNLSLRRRSIFGDPY